MLSIWESKRECFQILYSKFQHATLYGDDLVIDIRYWRTIHRSYSDSGWNEKCSVCIACFMLKATRVWLLPNKHLISYSKKETNAIHSFSHLRVHVACTISPHHRYKTKSQLHDWRFKIIFHLRLRACGLFTELEKNLFISRAIISSFFR